MKLSHGPDIIVLYGGCTFGTLGIYKNLYTCEDRLKFKYDFRISSLYNLIAYNKRNVLGCGQKY